MDWESYYRVKEERMPRGTSSPVEETNSATRNESQGDKSFDVPAFIEVKHCAICHEEFVLARPSDHKKYCNIVCRRKADALRKQTKRISDRNDKTTTTPLHNAPAQIIEVVAAPNQGNVKKRRLEEDVALLTGGVVDVLENRRPSPDPKLIEVLATPNQGNVKKRRLEEDASLLTGSVVDVLENRRSSPDPKLIESNLKSEISKHKSEDLVARINLSMKINELEDQMHQVQMKLKANKRLEKHWTDTLGKIGTGSSGFETAETELEILSDDAAELNRKASSLKESVIWFRTQMASLLPC